MATASLEDGGTMGGCVKLEVTSSIKVRLEWSVDKVDIDNVEGRCSIRSQLFNVPVYGEDTEWSISIHPRGVEELGSKNQGVYIGLHHNPGDKQAFETRQSVAFKTDKGLWPESFSDSRETLCRPADWRNKGVTYSIVCSRDGLQKVFVDKVSKGDHEDTFIVRQKLVIVAQLTIEVPEDFRKRSDHFIESMGSSVGQTQYSDVVLRCQGRTFPCHKVVLSARSPVLRAMFENDMKESNESEIEIIDSSPDIVETMIQHIYSGKIPSFEQLQQNAPEILHVAVKYNLVSLVSVCEESMFRELTTDNVIKTFIYVDRYSPTSKLRDQVLKFLSKNAKDIVGFGDWQEFISSYPALATEMFRTVIENGAQPSQASQLAKRPKLQLTL